MVGYVDKEHLLAADKAGCIPAVAESSLLEDLLGARLYRTYRDIAIREKSSVITVVRDILRKNAEGVA